MSEPARTIAHAGLLALLVGGAAYGVMMLVGFAAMVIGAAFGHLPTQEPTGSQILLGFLMVALWGGVIIVGLASLARQSRDSLKLTRWVSSTSSAPSPRLADAVAECGGAGAVAEVRSDRPYAFTHGIWRPRVVVSTGLVAQATHDELVAVLRHEGYHVRHRDPLKVLALRTWGAALAFLPIVPTVFQRLLDRQELRADRAAVRQSGVAALAGAMLKAVGRPEAGPATALTAIGGPPLLETRVDHLESGRVPGLLTAMRPDLARSIPGLAILGGYAALLYQVCLATRPFCML